MALQNKYRILIWVVVILLATNLSMGVSFLYHKQQDKKVTEKVEKANIEMPAQQRTRFFREQLNLEPGQLEVFRELNRDFNRTAWQINRQLESLRIEMVMEMGEKDPDKQKLEAISKEVGQLHTQLKNKTIDYYLEMKGVCTEEQQQKLKELFLSVLRKNEDVRLPQRGRRLRGNW
ncbi:periplasmic heavy metal sensor [Mariniphaga sediminis]|jgi:Spy/CpxP family protein refolding chaperone|uniref:Periplasmic heavy metal sensor n=1 Tax=Mariniphaga sediminis TaxID=1628158 RepID=A0A399D2W9_9BACT|nr:periplasmic heavy metal sensor [Mariniphaga sediminis]RIH65979.1 periplasmic heavy metal sensor [Mariniphaga sediminis]